MVKSRACSSEERETEVINLSRSKKEEMPALELKKLLVDFPLS